MKKLVRGGLCLLLALVLSLGLAAGAQATEYAVEEIYNYNQETSSNLAARIPEPRVGSTCGEWMILGMARSGVKVPEGYYAKFVKAVEQTVQEHDGRLSEYMITDHDRLILALAALGKDARDVAGNDLTLPLGDFELTCTQGANGPIWALIALDSRDYPVPEAPEGAVQATRQMYVDRILDLQLPDGGWNLRVGRPEQAEKQKTAEKPVTADPDMTAMALQALAKYQDQPDVEYAVERGLSCLSLMQDKKGGYDAWGGPSSESTAQVIVALCELGMELDHPQFVKNGYTLLDNLMSFRTKEGYFGHDSNGSPDQIATEQAMYALAAAMRALSGKNSLYRMDDAISVPLDDIAAAVPTQGTGLAGKDPDVKALLVTKPGITFGDIQSSPNRAAIETLAAREIINGMNETEFQPEATMTRAQYATIVVKALGLKPKANGKFSDVPATAWYAPYVGTANEYGIVNGVSDSEFNPSGTITRQEAAVMTIRAAKLCGLDTELSENECVVILCDYMDYRTIASWAQGSMAFCYGNGILDTSDLNAEPKREILRGEVAEMLYRMLVLANLI